MKNGLQNIDYRDIAEFLSNFRLHSVLCNSPYKLIYYSYEKRVQSWVV